MNSIPAYDDFHTKTKHISTLFQFIKTNKDDQFLEYISNLTADEVDVNMKDENGNYLIFFAIMMNNRKIVQKLIEYGSRMDIVDSEGYTVLYYPIKFNYSEIIDTLLDYDKKTVGMSLVNLRDLRDAVPIFYAIKYKNRHALIELLNAGADANYKNTENMNALHLAVIKRDITMVKILIKYVKNIDARTNGGSTALHYAANFQSVEIVKLLLEYGANQNIIEIKYDLYPIFYSVVQNNIEITKIFIDKGANPNNQNYDGNTIIHYAIIDNHIEILDYIIKSFPVRNKNADMYVENINSKNDLSADYIDPSIVNIDGLTIGHLLLYNYSEIHDPYLEKIIPHSNLNYQDNIGNTILHIIGEKNLWEKFGPLIENKKLNIYIKNNLNNTVIDTVQLKEREIFLNIVIKSYHKYLQRHQNNWQLDWQNFCSQVESDVNAKIDPGIINNIINNPKNMLVTKNTVSKTNTDNKCYDHIRSSIVVDKISVPIKINKTNIVIDNDEVVHFSTFTGSLLDMLVGFNYLVKKYPTTASLFHSHQESNSELVKYNASVGIEENPHQHIIYFEIRWIYQKLFLPPGFESIIAKIIGNKKYKYIVMPIGIILSNGHHSNALFYDISNRVMERFEPHGSDYPSHFNYNPDLLDEILYKKFSNIIYNIYNDDKRIEYYQPKHYLPKIGFQTFENTEVSINKNIGDPVGFCTLWTIWYLDYRLKYVGRKPQYIVKNLISQIKINNLSFRTIIRNYSKKITDLRDYYLSKINRNINDYLNNKFSQAELKKLLIEILTDN